MKGPHQFGPLRSLEEIVDVQKNEVTCFREGELPKKPEITATRANLFLDSFRKQLLLGVPHEFIPHLTFSPLGPALAPVFPFLETTQAHPRRVFSCLDSQREYLLEEAPMREMSEK